MKPPASTNGFCASKQTLYTTLLCSLLFMSFCLLNISIREKHCCYTVKTVFYVLAFAYYLHYQHVCVKK